MTRKSAKLALAVVVAVAVAGILAAYAVPRVKILADRRIGLIVDSLQDRVHEISGLRLGYDYIVLSSSDRLAVHGIQLFQESVEDYATLRRKVLSVGDLELRFDLWAALFGKPQDVIRHLRIADLKIDLDFPADLSIFDHLRSYLGRQPPGALPNLSVDVADSSISIRDGDRGRYSSSIPSLQVSTLSGALGLIIPHMAVFLASPSLGPAEVFAQLTMVNVSSSADFSDLKVLAAISGRFGGLDLAEQGLEARKVGDEVEVRVGRGKGLQGVVRYGLGTKELKGEVELKGYKPSEEVKGLGGVVGELLGLRYEGKGSFRYVGGSFGYEVGVKARGEEGGSVGGVSVSGMEVSVEGKGDGEGLSAVSVKGTRGVYEVGYEGSLRYEGLGVDGVVRVMGGGEGVEGRVKGEKGKYEATIGSGEVKGVEVKGLTVKVEEKGERYDVRVVGELGGGRVTGEGSLLKGKKGYEWGMELGGLEVVGLLRAASGFGVKVPELGVDRGEVRGSVTVRGDYEKVSWAVVGLEGRIEKGGEVVEVRGSGVGDGSRYEIKGMELGMPLRMGKDVVSVKGSGSYGSGVTFEGEVGYRGMRYGVGGSYREGVVKVKGDYGLEGEVVIGAGGVLRGSVKAAGLPVGMGLGVVYGDLSVVGAYGGGEDWWVEGEKVELRYEGEGEYPQVGMRQVKVRGGEVSVGELTVKGKGYGLTGSLTGSYKGGSLEGKGSFVGQGRLGDGSARYEVSLGYGGGRGRVSVGVNGYDLGLVGMKGYRATGYVEGSGEVLVEDLLRGDYGSLDSWAMKGKVGLAGGLDLVEQGLEARKVGDEVEVRVGRGKGLQGVVRYGLGTKELRGEVELKGYKPSEEVKGLGGVVGELLGLRYEGKGSFQYVGGSFGYEVGVKARGEEGGSVGGVSVSGMEVSVEGKGDGEGLSAISVKGTRGVYEVGYEGSLRYEGLGVDGVVRVMGGGEGVEGKVKGEKGKYEATIGSGEVKGVEVKGLTVKVEEKGERYDVRVVGELGGGRVTGEGSLLKGKKGYEWGMELGGLEVVGLLRAASGFGVKVPELGVDRGEVRGSVTVRGDYEKVSWAVVGLEGRIEKGGEVVEVRGSGVGDGSRYEIKGMELGMPLRMGKDVVSVKGSGSYGSGVTFEGEVGYRGMRYGVGGSYREGVVKVKGDYGLEGEVVIGAGGVLRGSVKAAGLPVGMGLGVVYGDLSVVGAYGGGEDWWVEGEKVELRYEGEGEYPQVGMRQVKVRGGEVSVGELTVKGKGYGLTGSLTGSYKGGSLEGKGSFVGQGRLGDGSARYEVSLGYGGGRGRVSVGVNGYDLGLVGMKGYRATGYVEGSGEVLVEDLLRGDYGSLDSWAMKGKVGLAGGLDLVEQGLEARKVGDEVEVRVGRGKGLQGVVRYGLGTKELRGEVELKGYKPSEEVKGLGGVVGELLGLRYEGKGSFQYVGGSFGYEVGVKARGEEGGSVGGVSVSGMEVSVEGKGDGEGLSAISVKGTRGVYEVGYEGSLRYEGLGVDGVVRVMGGGEGVEGKVKGEKGKYEATIGSGEVKGVEVKGLTVKVEDKGERYDVRVVGELGGGRVTGEGSLLKGKKGYEWGMELGGLEVVGLLRAASGFGVKVPELGVDRGEVRGSVTVRGDYEKVSWAVVGLEGKIEKGGEVVEVRGSGVGDGSRYEIKGMELGMPLRMGKDVVSVKGSGSYGSGVTFEGEVGYRGMRYGVGGSYREGVVKVKGDYGLEGEVVIGAGGVLRGSVKAAGLPVGMGLGVVYGDLSVVGAYGGGEDWWVDGEKVELRYEGEGEYPQVGMRQVKVRGGEVSVGELTVKGKGYGLTGSLTGSYKGLPQDPVLSLEASLRSIENQIETYAVSATYQLGVLDGKVEVSGLPIERYIAKDLRGVLDGTLAIHGPLELSAKNFANPDLKSIPAVKFEMRLSGGEYRNIPLRMSFSGTFENGTAKVLAPKIEYVNHQMENLALTFVPAEGKAGVSFDYTGVMGSDRVSASVAAEAVFTSTATDTSSANPAFSAEFSGKLKNIKYRETLVNEWAFSGTYGNAALSIEGGKGSLHASLASDGTFEASLRENFPITANIRGTMVDNVVAASIDGLEIDLKKLGWLISSGTMQVRDGLLAGNLSLKGPISDPDINGQLSLKRASLVSKELITGSIGPFDSTITFAGKNIEAAPTMVPLESGTVELSAAALLNQWNLTDLKLNVTSLKDSVVTLSAKIAGITVIDAKANVDMVLSLDNDTLVADGSIFFEKGQVLIDPQGFLPENTVAADENAIAYRIKASMTFGKQLEVYLPDNNIPLVRGFTSPGSYLVLQYDSASQDFSLDGKIELRTGYVLYYLRNFFLKSGTIEFSENSTKFNPLVTASAELRESSSQGPVKIMLNVEKSPLEHLNPRLSSIPFLSETQLIALMSGGVLAVDTTQTLDVREAAIASSEFIPQLNIFKAFEQNVQKALGLDIVFIRSSFIQRWLLDLTKPVTEANPEDPLARYLNQSELYLGKYVTDSAFLHAGVKFREDPLVSASRLRLDSEFGIELDSPFGLINWSITPSLNEGSLVTGQELSLSWRYVY